VDVTDRPYDDLVEALKATHMRLYAVHTGAQKPSDRRPEVN
jgi:hypothetical protein